MPDQPALWFQIVQAASYFGGAAAAGVAAARYLTDRREAAAAKEKENRSRQEANEVAERELQWRRAQNAQALMAQMENDPLASDAMLMLDWDGRNFPQKEPKWTISRQRARDALRVTGPIFTHEEAYVRDAFDRFFMYWEHAQHGIDVGLMAPQHVRFPLNYWAGQMARHPRVFEVYFDTYGFTGTKTLYLTMLGEEFRHRPPQPNGPTDALDPGKTRTEGAPAAGK